MRRAAIHFVCFAMILASLCSRGHASNPDIDQAISLYERAVAMYREQPVEARALFGQAAASFESALERHPRNSELHRAMGNALLLSEQTGPAVLAFSRAMHLDPGNRHALEALEAARSVVQVDVGVAPSQNALEVIGRWRALMPRGALAGVLVVSWSFVWLLIARSVWRRKAVPILPVVLASFLAAGSGTLLAAAAWQNHHDGRVVILHPTNGYRGPSRDVYEPSFEQTLTPGVEATVLETRDKWARVRLRSGSETWIAIDTFEYVVERRSDESASRLSRDP